MQFPFFGLPSNTPFLLHQCGREQVRERVRVSQFGRAVQDWACDFFHSAIWNMAEHATDLEDAAIFVDEMATSFQSGDSALALPGLRAAIGADIDSDKTNAAVILTQRAASFAFLMEEVFAYFRKQWLPVAHKFCLFSLGVELFKEFKTDNYGESANARFDLFIGGSDKIQSLVTLTTRVVEYIRSANNVFFNPPPVRARSAGRATKRTRDDNSEQQQPLARSIQKLRRTGVPPATTGATAVSAESVLEIAAPGSRMELGGRLFDIDPVHHSCTSLLNCDMSKLVAVHAKCSSAALRWILVEITQQPTKLYWLKIELREQKLLESCEVGATFLRKMRARNVAVQVVVKK